MRCVRNAIEIFLYMPACRKIFDDPTWVGSDSVLAMHWCDFLCKGSSQTSASFNLVRHGSDIADVTHEAMLTGVQQVVAALGASYHGQSQFSGKGVAHLCHA